MKEHVTDVQMQTNVERVYVTPATLSLNVRHSVSQSTPRGSLVKWANNKKKVKTTWKVTFHKVVLSIFFFQSCVGFVGHATTAEAIIFLTVEAECCFFPEVRCDIIRFVPKQASERAQAFVIVCVCACLCTSLCLSKLTLVRTALFACTQLQECVFATLFE